MHATGLESWSATARGGVRSEYLEFRKTGLNEGEGGGLAGFVSRQKPVRHNFLARKIPVTKSLD